MRILRTAYMELQLLENVKAFSRYLTGTQEWYPQEADSLADRLLIII